MTVEERIKIEKAIVATLVESAIAKGYKLSVCDGEAWPLKGSTSVADVMGALFSTDEEVIAIRIDRELVGYVNLIYGNDGYDVISDHTDTEEMRSIIDAATLLGNEIEADPEAWLAKVA